MEEGKAIVSVGSDEEPVIIPIDEKEFGNKKPKSKKKVIFIIVAVVLILACVGLGLSLFLAAPKSINDNNEHNEEPEIEKEEQKEEEKDKPVEEMPKKGDTALLPDGSMIEAAIYSRLEDKYGKDGLFNGHVVAIKRAKTLPEDKNGYEYDITDYDSDLPVYLWYEETNAKTKTGIIYFYSEAKTIYANEDFGRAFISLSTLVDISGLAEIDVSKTKSLSALLSMNERLQSIEALRNWDVSNVEDMSLIFSSTNITDLSPIANWNVSKVKDFSYLLSSDTKITSLSGLEKWNTAKASDMSWAFSGNERLGNIASLKNWNVSNVEDMTAMFHETSVSDLSPIANWDVSKLERASIMFSDSPITNATVLNSWNPKVLKEKDEMFDDWIDKPAWY